MYSKTPYTLLSHSWLPWVYLSTCDSLDALTSPCTPVPHAITSPPDQRTVNMENATTQSHETQGLRAPAHIRDLLAHLHKLSLDQEHQLGFGNGGPSIYKATNALRSDAARSTQSFDDVMRDKFIALTEDKAMFVYNMVRAKGALTVVEAGTSFGVSTIYLALAVGENVCSLGKTRSEARVIATEHEPSKAAKAREYWRTAGESVEQYIELREGDILQTLREDVPEVDFVLFDSMLLQIGDNVPHADDCMQYGHRWYSQRSSCLSRDSDQAQ